MSVDLSIIAFAGGTLVSLGASFVLVSRLERVGERLGLSEALLGMLAALAADAPEITAALTAVSHHQRNIGTGVVIGSNVFNLAALLGLGAIVAGRIGLHRKVVVLGGVVALWVAVMCLLVVSGIVGAPVGLGLVLAALIPFFVVLSGPRSRRRRFPVPERWAAWLASAVDEEELELVVAIRPQRGRPRDVLEASAALVVVVAASVTMERGASALGQHFHVADVVVGGLVLAAVTSLPNAIAAIYLAGKGRGAAALSTALNSNTFNALLGFLFPAAIVGLAKSSGEGLLVTGWYLGLTVLTLGLAYASKGLRRSSGWLIVVCYGAFVISLLATS